MRRLAGGTKPFCSLQTSRLALSLVHSLSRRASPTAAAVDLAMNAFANPFRPHTCS
jgi:hypothetical protein